MDKTTPSLVSYTSFIVLYVRCDDLDFSVDVVHSARSSIPSTTSESLNSDLVTRFQANQKLKDLRARKQQILKHKLSATGTAKVKGSSISSLLSPVAHLLSSTGDVRETTLIPFDLLLAIKESLSSEDNPFHLADFIEHPVDTRAAAWRSSLQHLQGCSCNSDSSGGFVNPLSVVQVCPAVPELLLQIGAISQTQASTFHHVYYISPTSHTHPSSQSNHNRTTPSISGGSARLLSLRRLVLGPGAGQDRAFVAGKV